MKSLDQLKVAFVHDFLVQYGGAEKVLEALCELFPQAPIYTLLYDQEKMKGKFSGCAIHTSFLQKFPKILRRRHKYLLPFMPTAPETFDLRDFDLVISSSGAWSKGIVTRLNTIHVSYLHSPMRFVWDANEEYLRQQEKSSGINFLTRGLLNYIRLWDKLAADRPDHIIANSRFTQGRIKKYYGRDSLVIYPPAFAEAMAGKPADTMNTSGKAADAVSTPKKPADAVNMTSKSVDVAIKNSGNYFLVVSRLSAYKKVDMIVEALNKMELPLVVIGEGEQEKYLRSIAGKNVEILGWQPDEIVNRYYDKARGFIFSSVDDFGIAPVEAMSHGVSVIALRKGGIIEVMEEEKTGEFFDAPTPEVIADGVRRFIENEHLYDREYIQKKAGSYSKERFLREFREYIEKVINNNSQ